MTKKTCVRLGWLFLTYHVSALAGERANRKSTSVIGQTGIWNSLVTLRFALFPWVRGFKID